MWIKAHTNAMVMENEKTKRKLRKNNERKWKGDDGIKHNSHTTNLP